MAPRVLRPLPLLLCLLLACTQATEPPRPADRGAVNAHRTGQSAMAGNVSVGASWNLTSRRMNTPRSHHTATQLLDGRILVVGGFRHTQDNSVIYTTQTAELYDPASGIWFPARSMAQSRYGHTATLLPNGKVLVVGGYADTGTLRTVELYDPVQDTWTLMAPMAASRASHTATLLQDGKVLITGGVSIPAPTFNEVYDPDADKWSPVGSTAEKRALHTATLLPDGKVLVVGGINLTPLPGTATTELQVKMFSGPPVPPFPVEFLSSAVLYDPATQQWTTLAGKMASARAAHTATLIPGRGILVAGGWEPAIGARSISVNMEDMTATGVQPLGSAELSSLTGDTWATTGSMSQPRAFHTATLLPDGHLLVAGGSTGTATLRSSELYDPSSAGWSNAGALPEIRVLHSATLLPGGSVLVAGGSSVRKTELSSSTLYTRATGIWTLAAEMSAPRQYFTATLLSDGKIFIAGGETKTSASSSQFLNTVEVYDPAGNSCAVATNRLHETRAGHTATLLPNKKVLVVGGYDAGNPIVGKGFFMSAELYDPDNQSLTPTKPLGGPRANHTATLLPTGKVLVAGGAQANFDNLYDPDQGTWTYVADEVGGQLTGHTATLLPTGKVLFAGGARDGLFGTSSYRLFDPYSLEWTLPQRTMLEFRRSHTATLLPDGKVLVTGGYGTEGTTLSTAELYDPRNDTWESVPQMSTARALHVATLLPTGQVLVTGGETLDSQNSSLLLKSAEVYDPITGSWTPAEEMKEARADHVVAVLPDGTLFVAGGHDGTSTRASTELYRAPGFNQAQRPLIQGVTPSSGNPPFSETGSRLTVTGQHFHAQPEASSGTTGSSAVGFPLLTLRSMESGRWVYLGGHHFSETSVTATLPQNLPGGHYLLNVTTRGLTAGTVILIRNTTPPDTVLTPDPAPKPQDRRATFSFDSNAPDRQLFECNRDGAGFSPCPSPVSWQDLSEGPHTFEVRAVDMAGNVDPEPAKYSWLVDTQAPDTQITSNPKLETGDKSASFSFSAEATDLDSFECSLDEAQFSRCTGATFSMSYERLSPGRHTFRVRALDKVGNVESEPAEYSWTIMRGYYGVNCAATGASLGQSWPWGLLLLGLRRLKLTRR